MRVPDRSRFWARGDRAGKVQAARNVSNSADRGGSLQVSDTDAVIVDERHDKVERVRNAEVRRVADLSLAEDED